MATKKLFIPLEDPPTASSTEDDEVENSSSSEEEENDPTKTTPPAAPCSDSETDSPAVKSKKKRSNEGSSKEDMHVKRSKKVSSGDDEKKSSEDNNNKKPYFQRLWSEEDEICVLQGMIDFKGETGTSPYDDMNGFYDNFKKNISFGVTKTQFSDKIRMLKRKYFGLPKKKFFVSSHDKKCLGLVKYIWGSDGLALESAVKSPVKSNKDLDSTVQGEKDGMALESKKKKVKSNGESEKVKSLDSTVQREKDGMALESKKKKGKSNGELENVKSLDSTVQREKDGMALESKKKKGKSNGELEKVKSLKQKGEMVEEDKKVFEKSFLVGSIVSLGVDECSVMQKWSKVPMETKKRIEEKLKLVKAKEFELLLQKTDILKEVTFVMISEAI